MGIDFEKFGDVILEVKGARRLGKTTYAIETAKMVGNKIRYYNNNYSFQCDTRKSLKENVHSMIGRGSRADYDVVVVDNASYFVNLDERSMLTLCNNKRLKIIIVW